jgi:membrane protease YdiL (CAAX protease family)
MADSATKPLKVIFEVRWRPNRDLLALGVSWLLVTAALYAATMIVGSSAGGGIPYFLLYAVLAATLFGVGIPLSWTVAVRHRPVSDLGLTSRRLGLSLILQVIFALLLYLTAYRGTQLPSADQLLPLLALALTIGLFEAIFWRGWMQLRLEDAFGLIPAILLASLLYAAYHIGYGMPLSEIAFLFLVGIMFATVFRLTKSVFILWPLFQPLGQLVTLIRDGLVLPMIATVGFVEALVLMGVLIWLAARYHRKHAAALPEGQAAPRPPEENGEEPAAP